MKTTHLNSFLKFYVMRSPGIDLYGIAHVKVDFIPLQKMYVIPILGRFVWTTSFVQCVRINNIKKLKKKIRQMEFLRLICVMQFITIMTFPWELWKPPNQPFDSDFSIKKKGGSRRLSSPAFLDSSNYSIYSLFPFLKSIFYKKVLAKSFHTLFLQKLPPQICVVVWSVLSKFRPDIHLF